MTRFSVQDLKFIRWGTQTFFFSFFLLQGWSISSKIWHKSYVLLDWVYFYILCLIKVCAYHSNTIVGKKRLLRTLPFKCSVVCPFLTPFYHFLKTSLVQLPRFCKCCERNICEILRFFEFPTDFWIPKEFR